MKKNIVQEFPEWFKGKKYSSQKIVVNDFSGEEFLLNSTEYSMYIFIYECSQAYELRGNVSNDIILNMRKAMDWLFKNNPELFNGLFDTSTK